MGECEVGWEEEDWQVARPPPDSRTTFWPTAAEIPLCSPPRIPTSHIQIQHTHLTTAAPMSMNCTDSNASAATSMEVGRSVFYLSESGRTPGHRV